MGSALLRWSLAVAGCCACAAPRPTPTPSPTRPVPVPTVAQLRACEEATRAGAELLDSGDWPGAVDRFRAARDACPDPRPASLKLAHALSAVDDADGAAEVLAALVTSEEPPLEAFTELSRVIDATTRPERERIAQLGSTPERAIHVPWMQLEYSWVAAFSCLEGHPTVLKQSLLANTRGDAVDALEFACGAEPSRTIYFANTSHSAPRG